MDLNTVTIIASVASLVVSIGAVTLAIVFYMGGRNTELRITTALAEIKAQTEALQKLSGKQIDKLLDHAFNSHTADSNTEITKQLLNVLKEKPDALMGQVSEQQKKTGSQDEQIQITLSIVIYFYTAQTNYWSQFYLPKPSEFDRDNQFHQLVKRIIDSSYADFNLSDKILSQIDENNLNRNNLINLFKETRDDWRYSVKSSSDVFIDREK